MNYEDAAKPAGKPLRRPQVLDIPDLARRGGLSVNVTPYRMGENSDGGFIAASAYSTVTVNRHVCLGLEKDVEDARYYVRTHPASPNTVAASFPSIATMPDQWIKRVIINQRGETNHETAARDIYVRHEQNDSRLSKWRPPSKRQESPAEISERRKKVIQPILDAKQWERDDWRKDAKVDWHTVDKYLDGTTRRLRKYNRTKLARSLGLERLPD